jgi:hypothetical protein
MLNTVTHLRRKKNEALKHLEGASATLRMLLIPGDGCPGHDTAFFEAKWMAQRASQLDAMTETQKEKREKIALLLGLEEELHVAL